MANKVQTRSRYRILTEDFNIHQVVEQSKQTAIDGWSSKYIQAGQKVLYDAKNCVYCANPTLGYRSYLNYMTMLNQVYEYWTNYGLFDQRYKPFVYLPSFWTDTTISEQLLQMATIAGVNVQRTPGISLMYSGRAVGPAEYWIYKDDLAELIQYAETQFYSQFGVEPTGKFSFGEKDPNKVRTTQLIRVYANMEDVLRENGGK